MAFLTLKTVTTLKKQCNYVLQALLESHDSSAFYLLSVPLSSPTLLGNSISAKPRDCPETSLWLISIRVNDAFVSRLY